MPEWVSQKSARVVLLAKLEQFIFTNDYSPPKTSRDEFELTFMHTRGIVPVTLVVLVRMLIASDAEEFMKEIEDLKKHYIPMERQHQAENTDESDDH